MSETIDVTQLARPVLAASLAIHKEIQRRERAKHFRSSVFLPKHAIRDLLEKQARYKVYYGGRGAIKSWGVAEALIRRADAGFERILCAREFQNSIKDSVHKLLSDTIDRMGLSHRFTVTLTSIRHNVTGAEFIFKGLHHNYNEIKSMEGITIVWVEEAQHVSDDSWMVLIPTIRAEGVRNGKKWISEIWITFNTTDEDAPTFKRFVNEENRPPSAIVHKINYDSNPYFPQVLREEMLYLKKVDYEAYLHVWEGFPKKISDAVVLAGKYRVEAFPDDLHLKAKWNRIFYGADFGFARDPSTLIRFFVVKNTLYIEYEAYKVQCDLDDMDKLYSGDGKNSKEWPGVPEARKWPIKGDNARPETISHLKSKFKYNISAADKWDGSVEDGIAHLRGFEEIIIHPRCIHTIEEARLWQYKRDAKTGLVLPILIDRNNHCWDAVRYGLDGYIKRSGDKNAAVAQALGEAEAHSEGADYPGSDDADRYSGSRSSPWAGRRAR